MRIFLDFAEATLGCYRRSRGDLGAKRVNGFDAQARRIPQQLPSALLVAFACTTGKFLRLPSVLIWRYCISRGIQGIENSREHLGCGFSRKSDGNNFLRLLDS